MKMLEENLFDNEEIRAARGFPSLISFFKGDPEKPLVVLFPGWAFLARIFYGAPGMDEKDFLTHWLLAEGYSVLAVSYPMDHPVYKEVFPGFTITDWGNLASDLAREFIDENGLISEVIALHWSASGQAVRPFNKASSENGLKVRFAVALEATPAIEVPEDRTRTLKKSSKNMISLEDFHYGLFLQEIQSQEELNGKTIISEKQYRELFFGDIPVGLTGTGEYFVNGRFVGDPGRASEDKRFFAFTEYPLVCVITGDSAKAPYHPIVDRSTWSFLNTRKIYHDLFASSNKNMSDSELNHFAGYVNKLQERVFKQVRGNHFMFLGEFGAREVARNLEVLDREIFIIKEELSDFLG